MKQAWWKEAVVYQIYPRSFMDSNGDGIGDLRGIIARLDYLKELGVDVIWLCPVYKSPNDDNGYDVSDYRGIMDEFGSMADWEELLAEVHKRGMKLIMDLVVNHSSDEHIWFVESRKSKDNPYRDYYIWRPAKEGREPNNWRSFFGGSAWEYDETTGEYYLHLFTRKQPDLNWENPRLRAEIYEMMKWWLDKGIDGFRMDVINALSKEPGLPDAPQRSDDPYQFGIEYYINGPRIHEFLQEMKREVLDRYDIMTVGETPFVTPEDAIKYTNEETGTLNMVFQFQQMDVDIDPDGSRGKWDIKPWKLTEFKQIVSTWQKELEGKGWNSIYLENHDQPRSISRFGNDGEYRVPAGKMLATLLLTLQGTPYIYQGQEIGMTNVRFDTIEDYRDVETLNMYREELARGRQPEELMPLIYYRGRDNARTPMQWDESENAGFSSGQPWIKVNPNFREINVARAMQDPDSIFHYYKRLIQLRKQNPIFVYGSYELLLPKHEQIYAYTRTLGAEKLLVVLNFSGAEPLFSFPAGLKAEQGELLIANYPVSAGAGETIRLRPYEARVYRFSTGTDRR